jgi:hypothetical protein
MYADGEALADLARDFADAIESGDQTAAARLQEEADAAQDASNADLKAYGLDECGAGS